MQSNIPELDAMPPALALMVYLIFGAMLGFVCGWIVA